MPSVTKNDVTIEYETYGDADAKPLLLLMGLGGQLSDWPPGFVDALTSEGFFVIAPDNRDQGLSTEWTGNPPTAGQMFRSLITRRPPPHQYLLADMAADHLAVLDELGVQKAHVAGMSMGGMLVQQLAIDHPDRVASMCSVMSTTGNPKVGRPKWKVARNLIRRKPVDRSEAVDAAMRTFELIAGPAFDPVSFRERSAASVARSYRPVGTARQLAAIMASGDRTDKLARVKVPTLVIHGAVDPLVTLSGGIATAEAVPDSRMLVFPEMGHYLPEGRWTEMAIAIRENSERPVAHVAPKPRAGAAKAAR